ncbi:F0F1 ATP synthase subunit A [Christensenella timonensis]|uniref:F0F1 ATP synthase subunit A n=1 Tax=Christensenella timonensis TaxID=1816678 RepID=UPI0008367508|nr:F0F1 ATP synthase subunit A [Christensenella timonensis]
MNIPSVFPAKVTIFGGIQVSQTLIAAFGTTIGIIIFALIFRFVILKNFKRVPKGFQNVMELMVDGVNKFSSSIMGDKAKAIAPYILTVFAFIILSGALEFLGIRSPATDLDCTIGLALITFVLIIAFSIRYRGVKGWLKTYAEPKPFMVPINVLSSLAVPVSLACRLFGNMFSGLVVMDMLYGALGYFAIGIPALASIYFILFHLGMQSYVFTMLTMSFMEEKL